MVIKLVAGLCRVSLALNDVCSSSPNVRRSKSGHVCWACLMAAVV